MIRVVAHRRGAVQMAQSRLISILSSYQQSEYRVFSNHSGKENEALLRALDASTSHDTTAGKDGKNEKFTLDDFFSNMDSSESSRRKGDTKRSRAGNAPSKSRNRTADNGAAAEEDLGSFFDQVNSIMKHNKARNGRNESISQTQSKDLLDGQDGSSTVSIFDIIPRRKPRSANGYDEAAFNEYSEMIERVIANPKFLRKHTKSPIDDERAKSIVEWILAEEPVINCHLPSLDSILNEGISNEEEFGISETLRQELKLQKQAIKDHYGWDEQQYMVAVNALTNLGALCAKQAIGAPLDIGWQKLKEAGFQMDTDLLHNYLYVSSTFSSRSSIQVSSSGGSLIDFFSSVGDSDTAASQEREMDGGDGLESKKMTDTASEIAIVQDTLFKPTEQSTSIRVRALVAEKRAKEAERLLDANAKNEELRLRTYAPVYKAYLDERDLSSAFHLFVKMKEGEHVVLQPETFVQLIACVAEQGYFREGSNPIEGIADLGYTPESGPDLFDLLVSELAENSVEISAASAKRLYTAFQRGFEDVSQMQRLHLLESIQVCNDPADANELVVSRVSLDEQNGRCPRTGTQLRLIGLDTAQKKQLQDGLIHLSTVSHDEKASKKNTKAEMELRRFGEWLDTRNGGPFTAIVERLIFVKDGPNIAYYMQNFHDGTFNYFQIRFVVDELEKMGENVLVILPKKYTQDSFTITSSSGNKRQRLTQSEKRIRHQLIESGKVYVVPFGCLDDYYWMFASVSSQRKSTNGQDIYIPPGNPDGRWPGVRPMLVSNDQMRDHKLSLLEPRLFRRWYSNFMVNFTFSAFVGGHCDDKEIGFRTADFYSREIQGNCSIDGRTTTWHFPVSDWEANESLCVRIPRTVTS
eukprot:scaffold388_cov114-Cylindrotheca_fusiformis.AAC.26